MLRTRIKMCGMTRAEDVKAACAAGADAIGLVFYERSPRAVTIEQAKQLVAAANPLTDTVALFVDADAGFVQQVIDQVKVKVLQFHGAEDEAFCQQFGLPYIKALRVRNAADIDQQLSAHANAPAILLDAFVEGVPGGTGECFDWTLIPDEIKHRLLLAGGLNEANVYDAVRDIQPMAVDLSGGIEISKGVKSEQKMRRFVQLVQSADQSVREISS